MKFLIYLLSLCILSLSCITCEDADDLINIQNNASYQNVQKSSDHTAQDNCSPLCTCNCCGQPTIVNPVFVILSQTKKIVPQNQIATYINQFVSDYTQNIWQPPKLNKTLIG